MKEYNFIQNQFPRLFLLEGRLSQFPLPGVLVSFFKIAING